MSRSTCPHLALCPGTALPESPPGPARFQCGFDDHGAVTVIVEQGALILTFFVRGGGNEVSVMSGDFHVVLVVRW